VVGLRNVSPPNGVDGVEILKHETNRQDTSLVVHPRCRASVTEPQHTNVKTVLFAACAVSNQSVVRTATAEFLLHNEFMDAISYGHRLLNTGEGLPLRGLNWDGFRLHRPQRKC
jgi:hypothetical protein